MYNRTIYYAKESIKTNRIHKNIKSGNAKLNQHILALFPHVNNIYMRIGKKNKNYLLIYNTDTVLHLYTRTRAQQERKRDRNKCYFECLGDYINNFCFHIELRDAIFR